MPVAAAQHIRVMRARTTRSCAATAAMSLLLAAMPALLVLLLAVPVLVAATFMYGSHHGEPCWCEGGDDIGDIICSYMQ